MTRRVGLLLVGGVVSSLLVIGCGDDDRPRPGIDAATMDGAPPGDGSVGIDAGSPVDAGTDAGIRIDAGSDAGDLDGGFVGCNPVTGIECDGDWAGRCTPACADGECCAPQMGRFRCVARDAAGACPAADLFVDRDRVVDNYNVDWRDFPADDCALVERCVDAPGVRRLLRFDTWTPNTGTADMYLGVPTMTSPYFEYAACHMHYHFNTYAEYDLIAADGSIVARGHKQAFCLLDFYHYPGTSGTGAVYNCGNQGIEMGWQDVYSRGLDCQWVDVTAVAPGDYMLRIRINTEHILNESNYANNEITVPVTIPPDDSDVDVTLPCTAGERGPDRSCGWTREGVHTCTAGAMVQVGCDAACGVGSCTGDTVLRICEGDRNCGGRFVLAGNDDASCGAPACGRAGGDCCSNVTFTCPTSGQYTVLTGAYMPGTAAMCTVGIM